MRVREAEPRQDLLGRPEQDDGLLIEKPIRVPPVVLGRERRGIGGAQLQTVDRAAEEQNGGEDVDQARLLQAGQWAIHHAREDEANRKPTPAQ